MPLEGIEQPEVIAVNDRVRLRKCKPSEYITAVAWYKDPIVYYNSEGITDEGEIPDEDYVRRMYEYLDSRGEFYFIEVLEEDTHIPVGDVILKPDNPAIAIGVAKYRGVGIGRAVMAAIIERVKTLGWTRITNVSVYEYNMASQRMFESLGFVCVKKENGQFFYEKDL